MIKFFDKKGLSTWGTIGAVIITTLLIAVLIFTFIVGDTGIISLSKKPGDITGDALNPCPCGSPDNDDNLRMTVEGVEKCVLSYGTSCPNIYVPYGFTVHSIPGRTRTACFYTKNQCEDFLIDNPEYRQSRNLFS